MEGYLFSLNWLLVRLFVIILHLKDTHVRFVMASDGFWDVVSIETVRCVGLNDKYKYALLIYLYSTFVKFFICLAL